LTIEAVVGDLAFTRALFSWAAVRASALRDPAIDKEDVEQEVRIALWQACRTHNPAHSLLKTWCRRHVEFAVANFLRVQSRKRRALQASLDAPVDGKEWKTLGDAVSSPRDDAERLETVHLVRWLIQELDLTPLETLALRVHVLGGTYRKVEQATGIPWKSLDNAWQRVRRKALELLQEEGLI
jgi:RNA polymerase sporulation-specific sigma factor